MRYGFGAVIAALPGFLIVANALGAPPDPLIDGAVTVTALAGITGSASGSMSIALAAMAGTFIANDNAAGIPMEVLHRVAAMASGGTPRSHRRPSARRNTAKHYFSAHPGAGRARAAPRRPNGGVRL